MLKQIGKYTINEKLGRGAFSRIYRAVDPQGRAVAVKMSTTQPDPEQLSQFQKDLVAAASVLHPNLVAVHDLSFEDGMPYLVMELVEGRDAQKLIQSRVELKLAEKVRAMQQVAEGLKNAHERGLVHLDIRPSKIMVTEDGTAKLLDLGLSRLSHDPSRVTENGYFIGAPFYMSPERFGDIGIADERCDIWSFGVTFYELVTGRNPFYDDDGERMVNNIVEGEAPPITSVPQSLNQVILKSLQHNVLDRYQSFSELLTDLKLALVEAQREESDALMAEALKQTDNGRWREARRIAKKLSEATPDKAPSHMFGLPENDFEKPMQTAVAAAVAAAATAAAVKASTAVETPLPQPPIKSPGSSVRTRPVGSPPPPPPPIAVRPPEPPAVTNGIGTVKRTLPPSLTPPATPQPEARVSREKLTPPPPPAPERIRTGSVLGIQTDPDPALFKSAGQRTRRSSSNPPINRPAPAPASNSAPISPSTLTTPRPERQRSSAPPAASTVRIVRETESEGQPWGKIAAGLGILTLAAAASFVFLNPALLKRGKIEVAATDDAKTSTRSGRVIKPVGENDPTVPAFSDSTATGSANSGKANSSESQTVVTVSNPTAANTTASSGPTNLPPEVSFDGQTASAARSFDPKSLKPAAKPIAPKRTTLLAPAPAAAANPNLTSEAVAAANLPTAVVAPPPPVVAATPPVQTAAVPAPTTSKTAVPETAPAAAVNLPKGGAFVEPALVSSVPAVYPAAAVQRRTQGSVIFQATITKEGQVKNLQLISGDPLLNVAAREAALRFKYRPATLNGTPIEVTQAIVIKFKLSN